MACHPLGRSWHPCTTPPRLLTIAAQRTPPDRPCGLVSALPFSPPRSSAPRRAAATRRPRPAPTRPRPLTPLRPPARRPRRGSHQPRPITTGTPTTTVTTVARPTATIDELVGAEGARVHVRCVGEGDTTVVLIAGFGGDTTGWANVEPAIAARARVCSYDRPGTGTSDPATATATFTTEATDLHDLLRTIGEPGPYVVVGQSFGGAAGGHVCSAVRRRGQRPRARRRLPHHVARRPVLRARRRHRGRRHRAWRLRRLPPDGQQRAPRRRRRLRRSVNRRLARVVADGCDHSRRSRAAQRPGGVRGGTPHRGLEPGSADMGGAFDHRRTW